MKTYNGTKCRYITDKEKRFSETAQCFYSKHLQNGPKRHEKHFFSMEWCFRAKKIFSKIDCELLLHANLTKLKGSLYLTTGVHFYSSKKYFQEDLTGKSFKHCMFKLTLQIGLYDQNLLRKKRTLISNLILSHIINFQRHRNSRQFQYITKRVYTFLKLDFVFLCCVQGVQCVLYNQPT